MSHTSRKSLSWTFQAVACCCVLWLLFEPQLDAQETEESTATESDGHSLLNEGNAQDSAVREISMLRTRVSRLEDEITELKSQVKSGRHRGRRVRRSNPANPQSPELRAPQYTRPPLAQFNSMVTDIENRVLKLRKQGKGRLAEKLEAQLSELRTQRSGDYPTAFQHAEVHMVGLYEAASRHDEMAPAKVRVTYTGAPVILVLGAYESVRWEVEIKPDVQIDQVIVSGYYEQEVVGLPESIPVWNTSEASGRSFYAYSRDDSQFPQIVDQLRELTGHELLTLQGAYRYPGKPFVVGPESCVWRMQHLVARMNPLIDSPTDEKLQAIPISEGE